MGSTKKNTRSITRLGRRVRKFRMSAGLSQSGLAPLFGLSRGYLSNIENGFKKASKPVANRITEVLEEFGF